MILNNKTTGGITLRSSTNFKLYYKALHAIGIETDREIICKEKRGEGWEIGSGGGNL